MKTDRKLNAALLFLSGNLRENFIEVTAIILGQN